MPLQLSPYPVPAEAVGGGESPSDDSIASRLQAIRLRFLVRLRQDHALLSRYRDASDVEVTEVALVVHRMAGSAGLVGFPQISRVAGLLDNALADRRPDTQALFDELIDVLRTTLSSNGGDKLSR